MFGQSNKSRFATLIMPRYPALCLCLFALMQILLVCGCAVIPMHPAQIPAFVPGDDKFGSAPKIAGHYANKGEAFTVEGESLGQVLLSRLLYVDRPSETSHGGGRANKVKVLFGDNPAYAAAETVNVLEPEPDVIKMQFVKQGQPVATRHFSKYAWRLSRDSHELGQPYVAVKGFIDITTKDEQGGASGYPGGIGMYQSTEEIFLRKAVDGSLIVLHREQGFGILVFVPFGGRQDMWCRFPPIEDGGQPQPSPVK